MHIQRNSACPCGSGKKFKKCCINRQLPSGSIYQEAFYNAINQALPYPVGSPAENSVEFQRLEDWANSYLSQINQDHPLYSVLSDQLCTHQQIIDLAKSLQIWDYLSVAEPLFDAWLSAQNE